MHATDLTGKQFPAQLTTTNDLELNGNQSLSATILPTKVNKAFISDLTEMWTITDHDNVEQRIIHVVRRGKGENMTVDIKAIPLFFDVMDTLRIYDRYDEHMTAQLAFTRIFEDTGFSFTLNGSFDAVQWEGFGDGETKLESFKRALERYKCEFRIVGNIVYLEHQIGNDTNHQYRHRLNASNIVQEVDANEMWTYAKGYGDYGDGGGGEDWQNAKLTREYTSPIASIIGIRHAPPIKNGNITTASQMDAQLKTLVDESLKISITADIHDLTRQNYPIAQSQLGDRVFVIDERIGLDEEVRIVNKSITRNWRGDILDVTLTFGSEGITKRYQSNLQTAIKDIQGVMDGTKKIPYSVLDNAVLQATQALTNAQTELTFGTNGILAVDKNDPNLVTIMNSAGLGVSRDGGATFENAITGYGINASVITAGILQGITFIQDSGDKHLEISNGEIFSYYQNQLAMKFGQYSLEFYNKANDALGRMIPITSTDFPDRKGLGFIVDNDILNIGFEKGGLYRAVLRTDFIDNVTTISGPYNNLNDGATLRLFANRRQVSEGRFTSHDQPAIILNQSDTSNDVDIYFGGFGRRNNAEAHIRWRPSDDTYRTIITAHSDGIRVRENDLYTGRNVDGEPQFRANAIRRRTSTNDANVRINPDADSEGIMFRTTSSEKQKLNIEEIPLERALKILDVFPVTWYDKMDCEYYARYLNNPEDNRSLLSEVEHIKRIPGLTAENVEEAGLHEFVEKVDEETVNINNKLWVLLIPIIRELIQKTERLEGGEGYFGN